MCQDVSWTKTWKGKSKNGRIKRPRLKGAIKNPELRKRREKHEKPQSQKAKKKKGDQNKRGLLAKRKISEQKEDYSGKLLGPPVSPNSSRRQVE